MPCCLHCRASKLFVARLPARPVRELRIRRSLKLNGLEGQQHIQSAVLHPSASASRCALLFFPSGLPFGFSQPALLVYGILPYSASSALAKGRAMRLALASLFVLPRFSALPCRLCTDPCELAASAERLRSSGACRRGRGRSTFVNSGGLSGSSESRLPMGWRIQ
jgi:hypothetical protein